MHGKTVVITGATSGIGNVSAVRLARRGARIVFVARDSNRGEETLRQLRSLGPDQAHVLHYADLSEMSEMRRVSQLIADGERTIDVLINNAGAIFSTRQVTQDGLERTFATNHMAYFVVTNMLLERLEATPGARVICTASRAYKRARLDFYDLQSQHRYRGLSTYSRSKLMNILFTQELARRLQGTSVTANCFHPGLVATRFGDSASGLMSFALRQAKKLALSPEQGALTLTYLASSPEVAGVTGQYFYKCRPARLMQKAQNEADAHRLWDISARLSGVGLQPAAVAAANTSASAAAASGTGDF